MANPNSVLLYGSSLAVPAGRCVHMGPAHTRNPSAPPKIEEVRRFMQDFGVGRAEKLVPVLLPGVGLELRQHGGRQRSFGRSRDVVPHMRGPAHARDDRRDDGVRQTESQRQLRKRFDLIIEHGSQRLGRLEGLRDVAKELMEGWFYERSKETNAFKGAAWPRVWFDPTSLKEQRLILDMARAFMQYGGADWQSIAEPLGYDAEVWLARRRQHGSGRAGPGAVAGLLPRAVGNPGRDLRRHL